jgi:hypothetical protein
VPSEPLQDRRRIGQWGPAQRNEKAGVGVAW